MGGALGIGLNYWMSRSWGFSQPAFTLYTFVTNLWDVMAKLSLPALALGALLLTGDVTHPQLANVAEVAMVLSGCSCCSSSRRCPASGQPRSSAGCSLRPIQLIYRLARLQAHASTSASPSSSFDARASGLLRGGGWMQLSLGMLAYSALQALLLWASLHMLGTTLTGAGDLRRLRARAGAHAVMITPAGTGFVEVGMTALLIALRRRPDHHGGRRAHLPRVHVRAGDPRRRRQPRRLVLATPWHVSDADRRPTRQP